MLLDALALYAKLKGSLKKNKWDAEKGEEFEDSEGNVMDKATYFDLERQGLL